MYHMEEDPSPTLSESRIYALLADRRRRMIVRILQDFPDPPSTTELTTVLADCEHETPTDRDRQRLLLSLCHNHLPRLNDAAIVDYDQESGTVRRGPNFGVLVGVIDDTHEELGAFAD